MSDVDTEKLRLATANAIKAYRSGKGLTQQAVSRASGLSRSYISELEDGKHVPTIDTIFRLALSFNIQPMTLLKHINRQYLANIQPE